MEGSSYSLAMLMDGLKDGQLSLFRQALSMGQVMDDVIEASLDAIRGGVKVGIDVAGHEDYDVVKDMTTPFIHYTICLVSAFTFLVSLSVIYVRKVKYGNPFQLAVQDWVNQVTEANISPLAPNSQAVNQIRDVTGRCVVTHMCSSDRAKSTSCPVMPYSTSRPYYVNGGDGSLHSIRHDETAGKDHISSSKEFRDKLTMSASGRSSMADYACEYYLQTLRRHDTTKRPRKTFLSKSDINGLTDFESFVNPSAISFRGARAMAKVPSSRRSRKSSRSSPELKSRRSCCSRRYALTRPSPLRQRLQYSFTKKPQTPRTAQTEDRSIRLLPLMQKQRNSYMLLKDMRDAQVHGCNHSIVDQTQSRRQSPDRAGKKEMTRMRSFLVCSDLFKPVPSVTSNINSTRPAVERHKQNSKFKPLAKAFQERGRSKSKDRRMSPQKSAKTVKKAVMSSITRQQRTSPLSGRTLNNTITKTGQNTKTPSKVKCDQMKMKKLKSCGKMKKCKECHKFRLPEPTVRTDLSYPIRSHNGCADSIFQKAPMYRCENPYLGRTCDNGIVASKKASGFVSNSLVGRGAFRAYQDDHKRLYSQIINNSKRKDTNTNKSLTFSEHLLCIPNSCSKRKVKATPDFSLLSEETSVRESVKWVRASDSDETSEEDSLKQRSTDHVLLGEDDMFSNAHRYNSERNHKASNAQLQEKRNSQGCGHISDKLWKSDGTYRGLAHNQRVTRDSDAEIFKLSSDSSLTLNKSCICPLNSKDLVTDTDPKVHHKYRMHNEKKTRAAMHLSLQARDPRKRHWNGFPTDESLADRNDEKPKELHPSCLYSSPSLCRFRSKSDNFETFKNDSYDVSCFQMEPDFNKYNTRARDETESSYVPHHWSYSKETSSNSSKSLGKEDDKNSADMGDKKVYLQTISDEKTSTPSFTTYSIIENGNRRYKEASTLKCHRLLQSSFSEKQHPNEHKYPSQAASKNLRHNARIKKLKMRHEPYKNASRRPRGKPVPGTNIDTMVFHRPSRSTSKMKSVDFSNRSAENISTIVGDSLLDRNTTEVVTDCISPTHNGIPQNKNNCSPSRNSQHDTKSIVEDSHVPSAAHCPSEMTKSIGFDTVVNSSCAKMGSDETVEKTYSIMRPRTVTEFETSEKDFTTKTVSQYVYCNDSSRTSQSQVADYQNSLSSEVSNKDRRLHETVLSNDRQKSTARAAPSSSELNRCLRKAPLNTRLPCNDCEDTSLGFRLSPGNPTSQDCGVQTSPLQGVGVAVQTSLSLAPSERGFCQAMPNTATSELVHSCSMPADEWKRLMVDSQSNKRTKRRADECESPPKRVKCINRATQTDVQGRLASSDQTRSNFDNSIELKKQRLSLSMRDVSSIHNNVAIEDSTETLSTRCSDRILVEDSESPLAWRRTDVLSSASQCPTSVWSTEENTESTFKPATCALRNSKLNYSYSTRPNFSNIKIDEIDRRVQKALRLRQELKMCRSGKSKPYQTSVQNHDMFLPLTQSTPKNDYNNTSKCDEISKIPNTMVCASFSRSSDIESCPSSSPRQTSIAACLNTSSSKLEWQANQGKDGTQKPYLFQYKGATSKRSQPIGSRSTSPSVWVRQSHGTVSKSSSRSTSTKLQRSQSFHMDGSCLEGQIRQRSASDILLSNQHNSNLKRSGIHEKNSPPTKIPRMENHCPKLIAELVQTLPRVPLASFVEWFIETANPDQSIVSINSPDWSNRDDKGRQCPHAPLTGGINVVERHNGDSEAESGRRIHGDVSQKQSHASHKTKLLAKGKSFPACPTEFVHNHRIKQNEVKPISSYPFTVTDKSPLGTNPKNGNESDALSTRRRRNSSGQQQVGNDNIRRTVIALRNSSEVSGIVTRFSCLD